MGFRLFFGNPSTSVPPAITSVSSATPSNGASLTITGTNFGASQGSKTVKIGGTTCTVTGWGDTSITVTVDRGTNKYGIAVNVEIWDTVLVSNSYALTSLQPQSGWSYVNLGTINGTSDYILTTVAPLASGDQVAYDNKAGLVSVATDGTFSAHSSVHFFAFEAWTPSSWGSSAIQSLMAVSAAAAAVASATAALTTAISLAAAEVAQATMTAALSTEIRFGAAQAAQASMTADMSTAIQAAAALSAQATMTAALASNAVIFAADLAGTASLSANLSTQILFAATPAEVPTMTAGLTTWITAAASLESVCSMTAALTAVVDLSIGLADVKSFVVGPNHIPRDLIVVDRKEWV